MQLGFVIKDQKQVEKSHFYLLYPLVLVLGLSRSPAENFGNLHFIILYNK